MISNSGTTSLGLYDFKRQIDAFGGVDYFRPTLASGYLPNARVMLNDGEIVQNSTNGNLTNDPNTDMTGWVKENDASQITYGESSQETHNKSSATLTDYLTANEISNSSTTDLSAKLQAINDDNEIGKLRLTKGVYLIDSDVVFNRSFSFDLDVDAFFKFGTNGSIRFTGSAQLIGKPTANITRLNKTISIADTSLINEMDWLCIWNPTDFSYSPQRAAYRAGEFVKVASKTSSSFNIFGKTFEAYSASDVDIYKVSPITISFNRFNVIASNTGLKNPVTFTFCENLDLSNYMNNGSLSSGITLDRCYNVTLPNLMATNNSALVGLNYGITIGNSQNVRIHGGNPLAARHCITTGGNGEICSVPCREIFITSMSLKSSDVAGIAAADFHGNTSDSYYQGCTMDHGAFGGKNITIRDCTVSNRVIDGSCLIFQDLIGGEVNIDNVTLNTSIASSSARSYIDITLLNDLKEDLVINIKDLKIYGDVSSVSPLIAFKCAASVVVTKKITLNIEVDSYVTQQGAFLNIQGGAAQPILPNVEINILRANSKTKGVYYVHPTTTATAASTKLNLPKQIGSQLITTAGEATGIKHGDLITLPYYYPVPAKVIPSVGSDTTWVVDSTFNLKPVSVMYYGSRTTQVRFALVSGAALPASKIFEVSYELGL